MSTKENNNQVLEIPIHQILPDQNQPRKSFNEDANIELAMSIKQHGIIQPILLTPLSKSPLKYRVVYGHRRLWGAKYLKMETIPAQVKDLSDDDVFEIQIIENLQRKDINPMEESDAFQKLVKKGLSTPEQISDRLGVSVKYIYDRLALQKTIPEVQEKIRDGVIPISHGKQFAKLSIQDQNQLWDAVIIKSKSTDGITLSTIKSIINDSFSLKLEDALFDIKNASLVKKAGSCIKCPKRSGCNQLLFDDVESKDVCFDKSCFDNKIKAHINKTIDDLKTEGFVVKLITTNYSSVDGYLGQGDWTEVDMDDEEEIANSKTRGIIMLSRPWEQSRIGQVLILENDKEEGENDIDQEEEVSGGVNTGTPYIDWEERLNEKLATALSENFKKNKSFPRTDIKAIIAEKIMRQFGQLEPELTEVVVDAMGWEKIVQEDNEPYLDNKAIIEKVLEKESTDRLLEFVTMLNTIERSSWDEDDAEEVINLLSPLKIDFMQILLSLEEEAGKKIIHFSTEEN